MKIALSVDGSRASEELFLWYCKDIHRPEHHIDILHVGDEPKLPNFRGYGEAVFPKEEFAHYVSKCKAKAQALENKFLEMAKTHQVNCKFHILVEGGKSPGEIIVKYLSKNPADMIVIGTRGVGTVRRTVLGSVSTYLIHHSPVPVVVHRNTKS